MGQKPKRPCRICGVASAGNYCLAHEQPADARPTAHQRGYTSNQWRPLRDWVLERDQNQCQCCGGQAHTVDHIWPIRRGGKHEPSNCKATCRSCHQRKTIAEIRMNDEELREFIGKHYV